MTVLDAPSVSPGELPVHLTRFVGRDRELDNLAALINTVRLLTLTGAGGSGKTRLAREVASRVADSFTRTVWVDLTPLTDESLVAEQVAAALHARETVDVTPMRMLIDAIGAQRVLVILDNCEHLVNACANVAESMLRACPRLTVLATSREALGVASETAWLVPPLGNGEATELFVERAQATLPAFAMNDANGSAVHEICRRLDGIPLAIELAAARVRVLSPEQIATRLDDAFRLLSAGSRTALPRHRTLRATMEWSFGLLAEREQLLLRRLSVFAGSFTLESAEAVCAGHLLEVEDILDGVAALVDKSLVVMEAGDGVARYRLLETVRQYGRERLTESAERDAMERRHADHFLAIVEEAMPNMVGGSGVGGVIPRLAAEHDNIRAASMWAVADVSRTELGLRFAGGLFWFWYSVGQFRENRQIVDRALALDAPAHPVHRGRALLSSGLTGLAQGDYVLALDHLRSALAILREQNDEINIGTALAKYGAAYLLGGNLPKAVEVLDEAVAHGMSRGRSDIGGIFARFWRGWAAYAMGDLDLARALFLLNLEIGKEINHPTTIAHSLATVARIECAQGNVEEACLLVMEGLELETALNDAWGTALALDVIALTAAQRGRLEDSARIVAGTEAYRERVAIASPGPAPIEREQLVNRLRTELGDRYDAIFAEGRTMPTPELIRIALAEAARHTVEQRISIMAEPSARALDARPRLRVSALGSLQVFVGDQPIDSAAWGSARPRELLVYLLMHPDGRTKEQVGLAFWPEASASQLRNNFHVTLHRLRRALGGTEWIQLTNDRYCVDPSLVESFDVRTFDQQVTEARRSLKRREDGSAAQLEHALSHFRGDLLDGEAANDWHLEHRDHLQRVYVDALMELGTRHLEEVRPARAADAFRRVLSRDELHEDAALALMRCHAAVGERAQALRVYRRIADKLRAELDAEPNAELEKLSEQLQQSA
ncbi:MAG TPA: BTAD domain-containing putative transcriptional regulator [Gemmatimonadaceae bacterium]|jgi:predicted ATPase/DNA-binding SARP family transcriptional activator